MSKSSRSKKKIPIFTSESKQYKTTTITDFFGDNTPTHDTSTNIFDKFKQDDNNNAKDESISPLGKRLKRIYESGKKKEEEEEYVDLCLDIPNNSNNTIQNISSDSIEFLGEVNSIDNPIVLSPINPLKRSFAEMNSTNYENNLDNDIDIDIDIPNSNNNNNNNSSKSNFIIGGGFKSSLSLLKSNNSTSSTPTTTSTTPNSLKLNPTKPVNNMSLKLPSKSTIFMKTTIPSNTSSIGNSSNVNNTNGVKNLLDNNKNLIFNQNNIVKRNNDAQTNNNNSSVNKKVLNGYSVQVSTLSTTNLKPISPTTTITKKGTTVDQIEISKQLSPEQRQVLQLVLDGHSIFFTGSAGTGKSFLLKEMVRVLKLLYPEQVYLTASTGIAACNIGGTTVYSFGNIGTGEKSAKDLVNDIVRNKTATSRWKSTKILIIDEISMVSSNLLDKLEYIARIIRKSSRAFGGIQLVLCGDFCQLPPVAKNVDTGDLFCFKADCWNQVIEYECELKQVFRQKDVSFVNILNEMRFGVISDDTLQVLNQCQKNILSSEDGIIPTILYPHRYKVDGENERNLASLSSEAVVFEAQDQGKEDLLKSSNAPAILTLKLGAQVILLKNLDFDLELVNGSRGVVVRWQNNEKSSDDLKVPVVRFTNGVERVIDREIWRVELGHVTIASRKQIPLSLAYALSIHKSQGMTIDKLVVSLDGTFEYGQAYVALSRSIGLKNLQIKGQIKKDQLKVHKDVIKFYQNLSKT